MGIFGVPSVTSKSRRARSAYPFFVFCVQKGRIFFCLPPFLAPFFGPTMQPHNCAFRNRDGVDLVFLRHVVVPPHPPQRDFVFRTRWIQYHPCPAQPFFTAILHLRACWAHGLLNAPNSGDVLLVSTSRLLFACRPSGFEILFNTRFRPFCAFRLELESNIAPGIFLCRYKPVEHNRTVVEIT
jgi:hypothetical protein